MTELILRETNSSVECLNFANPGYSSHQGKVFAKTYLPELEPDLVVVSFGWNDRWRAYGAPDEVKSMTEGGGAATDFGARAYAGIKLLQLGRKALAPILGESKPLDVSRVPIESFTKNLEAIGAAADSLGAPVIFATEPSSHRSLGVPDDVVTGGFAPSKEASLDLLARYNGAVRGVARERRAWRLVDLDSLVSSRSDVREIFAGDGVCYSKAGAALIADLEAQYIREIVATRPQAIHA
jgi:lysophospholipase L1-like esterase